MSALFMIAGAVLFIVIVTITPDTPVGAVIAVVVIAAICALAAARQIYMIQGAEKHVYSPLGKNSEKVLRRIEKARECHEREQSERRTLEDEIANPGYEYCFPDKKCEKRMYDAINSLNCTYEEFRADFMNGEIFHSPTATLNIGERYTFYRGDKVCLIFENEDIFAVEPVIVTEEHYINCVFMNIYQRFFVRVTVSGDQVDFELRGYTDRLAVEAFQRRKDFLAPGCEIFDYGKRTVEND